MNFNDWNQIFLWILFLYEFKSLGLACLAFVFEVINEKWHLFSIVFTDFLITCWFKIAKCDAVLWIFLIYVFFFLAKQFCYASNSFTPHNLEI